MRILESAISISGWRALGDKQILSDEKSLACRFTYSLKRQFFHQTIITVKLFTVGLGCFNKAIIYLPFISRVVRVWEYIQNLGVVFLFPNCFDLVVKQFTLFLVGTQDCIHCL